MPDRIDYEQWLKDHMHNIQGKLIGGHTYVMAAIRKDNDKTLTAVTSNRDQAIRLIRRKYYNH